MTNCTLIAPGGAPRFTGATVEEAVKAAGLRVQGGAAYLAPGATLAIDDHYCLVGAGITDLLFQAPPAEEQPHAA